MNANLTIPENNLTDAIEARASLRLIHDECAAIRDALSHGQADDYSDRDKIPHNCWLAFYAGRLTMLERLSENLVEKVNNLEDPMFINALEAVTYKIGQVRSELCNLNAPGMVL